MSNEDEDCYHEDEEFDFIAGVAVCDQCGRKRQATYADLKFYERRQAQWDDYCSTLDAQQ